jgi:excisionase family DNA binding protein
VLRGRRVPAPYLTGMIEAAGPMTAPSPQLERLLSVEELSDYLGVPVRTLYDWRVDGRGPKALHAGRVLRYPESAVRSWIEANLDD